MEKRSSDIYFLVSMVLEMLFGCACSIIAMVPRATANFRCRYWFLGFSRQRKDDYGIATFATTSRTQNLEGSLNAFMINGKHQQALYEPSPLQREALRNL